MQVYATVTLGLLVNKGAWCFVWGGSIRGQGPPTSSSYERMWLAMPGLLLRAVCLRNSRERVHGSSLLPFLQISRQHIPLNLNIFVWDFNPVCLTLEPISFLPWTSRLLPQLEQNLVMQWLLPPSSVLSATLPAVRVFALPCTWALLKDRIHFLLDFHLCCHIVVVERTKTCWINSGIV